MPVTTIKELRILPPLAIARFGSSPEPLENYEIKIVGTTGFRHIQPAPTLIVDADTGAIEQETTPNPNGKVAFRDSQGRVKPLAPFLEVWARFENDGAFEPLTKNHLVDLNLQPSDVEWHIQVANIKAFRRTGHVGDKVTARVSIEKVDGQPELSHQPQPLLGQSPHFKAEKSIRFGIVQYILPTDAFPEIRFRFTPGAGQVYGPRTDDPLVVDDVYAGVTSTPAPPHGNWSYPFAGAWDRYWIGAPNTPPVTAPADIFQGQDIRDTKVSDGYLDDTCDGIVEVRLRVKGTFLAAYARIMSGVPDFAPDSFHVRTIADDLEQMAFGPEVAIPTTTQEKQDLKLEVEDIVRRAYETVRLMNTMVQNGDQDVGGVPRNRNNMPGQQNGDYGRVFEPVYPTGGDAEYGNVLARHRAVLTQALSAPALEGSFFGLERMRPFTEIGDLTTPKRQRMPAMMRGSDGLEMALTRRQLSKLRLASPPAPTPEVAVTTAPVPKPQIQSGLRSVPPRRRHSLSNESD